MSYYESAEGITINDRQALRVMRQHGFGQDELDSYRVESGAGVRIDAQDLLGWLGY